MEDTMRIGSSVSCCRLCLSEKLDGLKSVYDEAIEDRTLPQKILLLLAIKINSNDKLSTMVCTQCITTVNNWREYRRRCIRNQAKLQHFFLQENPNQTLMNGLGDVSVQIKEEPMGEDDAVQNITQVRIKSEPLDHTEESMETEYNELPPALTPHPPDHLNDSADDGSDSISERICTICNKELNSAANRKKHEKLVHGKSQSYRIDSYVRKSMNEVIKENGPAPSVATAVPTTSVASAVPTTSVASAVPTTSVAPAEPATSEVSADTEAPESSDATDAPVPCDVSDVIMTDCESSVPDAVAVTDKTSEADATNPESQEETLELSESDQQKIQFAAGLKLLQKNSTPISCEALSKIELSYIEKCKAMVNMHRSLQCACHKVQHHNIKGLLSHLRALRIWFPVFTCYNCMITFTDRSTFTKHNVRCPKTSLETIMKLSNLRKRSEVKTRLYQNFKCTDCSFMYSFHEDFCKHIDEDHGTPELPYICICSRTFDSVEDYKDHVYVSCFVLYYCDICFITTTTLEDFQKHAVETHDNSEGFILLQDDNYKMRKPFMHTVKKEKLDENAIITGKRERRMSTKVPIFEYREDTPPPKMVNPLLSSALKSHCKTCPICSKEYSSYNNMMRHYKTHAEYQDLEPAAPDDDSFYSCPECGGVYTSNQWQQHLAENHEPKPCGECNKVFQFQNELDQHRSVHLNLKVYRDSKTQSLKTAMISPTHEGEILLCDMCDMVFSSKEELLEHNLIHDNSNGFPGESELPEQIEQPDQEEDEEEDNKGRTYSCEICDKVYYSYSGIWDHNKRKHPDKKIPPLEIYPKQCKYCDKVLSNGAAYSRHKMIHEKPPADASHKLSSMKVKKSDDEDESYHTCKRCFKVFSSKYNLKNHMKSHGINWNPVNKKPNKKVVCSLCHEVFLSNDSLTNHMKREHPDEEIPKIKEEPDDDVRAPIIFTCDICVMTFSTKMALKKHKETHYVQEKPRSSTQVYCKYCKIAFDSVMSLTKHMHEEHDETPKPKISKTVEKQRAFTCHICKKSFQTSPALATHIGWHKRGQVNVNSKVLKVIKQEKGMEKIANSTAAKAKDGKLQCATCLLQLPNDTALQVHILEKHRSVSAIMLIPRCNICNQDFSTQDEYETHKRLHDFLERQKQHELLMTQQQPSTTQSKQTVQQSKGGKNFPCTYCTAGFSRADTLGAHVRQFHKEYVKTEYRCTECDRVFDKPNSLSIHLKVHEKQRAANVAPTKPLFSCSICSMGFDLPKDLRAHTITAHPF